MSTKLTRSPRAGFELVESQSLTLFKKLGGFQTKLMDWLIAGLHKDGFHTLTASQLAFLGELECGDNHASELARRLNISRQAVHKTVKELCAEGWLETKAHESIRNQKVILFTDEGERLMSVARSLFAELDKRLEVNNGHEDMIAVQRLIERSFFY